MLDILEEFCLSVRPWFQARAAEEAEALTEVLAPTQAVPPFASETDYDAAPSWFDSDAS